MSLSDGTQGTLKESKEVQEFLRALKSTIHERGDEVCCIAGVDLSHVGLRFGLRFGQSLTLSPSLLKQLETEDRKLIQLVVDLDAEGFLRRIVNEKDRTNVCGIPAIYTLLKIINAGSGRLLKYDQAADQANNSVVTFASAAFYA